MRVTNAQLDKSLSPADVDVLLNAHLNSLQSLVVQGNPRAVNSDLQKFVAKAITGIRESAALRQRLLDEQVEMFDKHRDEFERREEHKDRKLQQMKEELDSRPFQKNFDREEDFNDAVLEQEELAKVKHEMDNKVAASKYSDVGTELEQLEKQF